MLFLRSSFIFFTKELNFFARVYFELAGSISTRFRYQQSVLPVAASLHFYMETQGESTCTRYVMLKYLACAFFCVTIKMRPILHLQCPIYESMHDEIPKNSVNTHRDIFEFAERDEGNVTR